MNSLGERKRQILYAVVNEFILSAEPVSSSQVVQTSGLPLSSATVRNVMSELEERGYLQRSHASSGRIPTHAGYRFYVDQLMNLEPLNPDEKTEIQQKVFSHNADMNEIIKEACHLLANRTQQAGVVSTPKAEERSLKHIQFCKLRGNVALAILVSSSGLVENKIIELEKNFTQPELDRIHNFLNNKFCGLSIAEIRKTLLLEMKQDHNQYDILLTQALELGNRAFSDVSQEVHIEGQSHLLEGPEFASHEKMQQVLRTLEEKTLVLRILDQCMTSPGVKISIGSEVACPEIDGLTLITSAYSDSEGNRGILGVIGPTRIQYARIVPLVDFTSKLITNVLQERKI